MKKVAFFDTKPFDQEFFDEANRHFGFELKYFRYHLHADTAVLAKGYDAVCVFVNDRVDSATVSALIENGVRLIALRCAGFNNVDLKAAEGKIRVVRVPEYSPHGVAEHAVALMLALNRKLHRAYYRTRDNNFTINGLLGFDMFEKTAGVIGTGKIGRTIVPMLRGFGMEVLLYDPFPNEVFAKETGARYVPLEEIYEKAHVLTLHCPLTPENARMVNQASIARMRHGVMIINTGRGKLIDTKALIDGLKSGKVGAAGLDVYEEESQYFFEDHSGLIVRDDVLERLLTFPNVIITSHQAFFTREALTNIANTTLENIAAFFSEGPLVNEVRA